MHTGQAYITGFVKRANEYGLNGNQALQLLKQAIAADGDSKPLIAPTAPKPVIKKDPMNLPISDAYGPKPNIPPAPAPKHVPNNYLANQPAPTEQDVQNLANAPLSSMTPKDHWTQGLHDILAKRPATQLRDWFLDRDPKGMPNSENLQRQQHMRNLTNAFEEAVYPGSTDSAYPLGDGVELSDPRVANREHVKELANHIRKYDPSWGNSFRIPIAKNNAPVEDPDSRDIDIARDNDWINNMLKYIGEKARNSSNNNLTNNVNIPTGL